MYFILERVDILKHAKRSVNVFRFVGDIVAVMHTSAWAAAAAAMPRNATATTTTARTMPAPTPTRKTTRRKPKLSRRAFVLEALQQDKGRDEHGDGARVHGDLLPRHCHLVVLIQRAQRLIQGAPRGRRLVRRTRTHTYHPLPKALTRTNTHGCVHLVALRR